MRLSRPGIVLSVLLHAAALYGLLHWGRQTLRPPQLQAGIVWFVLQELVPTSNPTREQLVTTERSVVSEDKPPTESPKSRSQRPARQTQPRSAEPASAPAPTLPSAQPPSAALNRPPVRDLVEARRRAAADTVDAGARADEQRSFLFPGTIAGQRAFDESERLRRRERGLQPPPSAFDSEAKGRVGLAEEPAGPYGVHWVSDDCYVFREPTERFVLRGLFVEPTTCTRRFARTDLFVTAKPSYLMNEEERAAVAAETTRRESLRRPTTGAVTPLAKD
jgi:hypothetical protein